MRKVLIANRGEIARRIVRTCRRLGIATVAVFSDADADSPLVREADEAVRIGPAPAAESYLVSDKLLEAARRTGADAIHPGFGFLSENEAFARTCEEAGVTFIGPRSETIAAMGSKAAAKALMTEHGVPVVPGYSGEDQGAERLHAAALEIGFPVLLKASAGGGGKGMRVVEGESGLDDAISAARREATSAFGDDRLLIERYVQRPRHVEFQILGDTQGTVLHLHERECSIQRRHQKIFEESPSVALDDSLRERMAQAAVRAGEALGYVSAGTVEFILDASGEFYFLEVNTRLQVEHPVTEMVTGLDLVELQLRIAAGHPLPMTQAEIAPRGHAIEARLYAEDAERDFLPATGTLHDWHLPELHHVRVDGGVETGDEVPIHYDPMLAKVIAWGPDRETATQRLTHALDRASLLGTTTNRDFLRRVLRHPAWASGDIHTHFVQDHAAELKPVRDADAGNSALIAATVLTARVDTPSQIMPGLTPGWRNNRWRDLEAAWTWPGDDTALTLHYRHVDGSQRFTVSGEGAEAVEVRIVDEADGGVTLEIDGLVRTWRWARIGARVWLHDGAESWELTRLPRFPDAEAVEEAGSCLAPMPGRILQVLVEVGRAVEAGDSLMILEAMKMEHRISAPAAGIVREVLAGVGDQVDADAALVLVEPETE